MKLADLGIQDHLHTFVLFKNFFTARISVLKTTLQLNKTKNTKHICIIIEITEILQRSITRAVYTSEPAKQCLPVKYRPLQTQAHTNG